MTRGAWPDGRTAAGLDALPLPLSDSDPVDWLSPRRDRWLAERAAAVDRGGPKYAANPDQPTRVTTTDGLEIPLRVVMYAADGRDSDLALLHRGFWIVPCVECEGTGVFDIGVGYPDGVNGPCVSCRGAGSVPVSMVEPFPPLHRDPHGYIGIAERAAEIIDHGRYFLIGMALASIVWAVWTL